MREVELYHHGIKGQKWGIRRFQNKDGSYKPGSEGRYDGDGSNGPKRTLKGNLHRLAASNYNLNARTYSKLGNKALASMNKVAANSSLKKAEAADLAAQKKRNEKLAAKENKRNEKIAAKEQKRLAAETKKNEKAAAKEQKEGSGIHLSDRQKKALKVGAAIAGTALAAYGAKKLYDHVDATMKGKTIAKKLLNDAGGDFEKASAAWVNRRTELNKLKGAGELGKYGPKQDRILDATRKSMSDLYRKNTNSSTLLSKDLQAAKEASRAARKEQFAKATKGVRDVASKAGSRAKSGADAARSKASGAASKVRSKGQEAAKSAKSAYERNAGKRMANAINRDYARRQAFGKVKSGFNDVGSRASRAASEVKSRASSAASNAKRAYERNAGERMAKAINRSYERRIKKRR